MRKSGLCVRYDCDNYGSMLQIYATQRAIENCGWKYEIIRYDKKTFGFLVKNIVRIFNPYFMYGKMRKYRKRKCLNGFPEIKKNNAERLQLFSAYRKQYIGSYSPIFKGYKNLVNGSKRYDAVMVGSDQLWTPAGLNSKFYNLLFVPDDIKKISLATSFGVTEIPGRQIPATKRYLNRIDYLSVRETAGANIVKKLINKNVLVAVDPTLLFDGSEWNNFFPFERKYENKYVFAYFLGTSIEHRHFVEKFAQKKNLEIITCPMMDEFVEYDLYFGDVQMYKADPTDFLNLIRGAQYVFTDSFHGSIFSILNHKQFITFNRYSDSIRKGKNSRIDSLFNLLELQSRHCTNSVDCTDMMEEMIDYQSVDQRLKTLREETWNFIRDALSAADGEKDGNE